MATQPVGDAGLEFAVTATARLFKAGEPVRWWYTPRGGYGFGYPVNGVVTKVGRVRVRVQVARRDGTAGERWISPEHLRHREVTR